MKRKQGFFAFSTNPIVWAFFAVALVGLIGWLTIGGVVFAVPIAIGIIGGSVMKSRDESG